MTRIKFKKDSKEFHNKIIEGVEEYFTLSRKSKKANLLMWVKTFFFLTSLIVSYVAIVAGGFGLAASYGFWIILGLSSVFLAVNCGHDAIHGAYSNNESINVIMSKTFDFLGANSYLWSLSHNIVHHTYTSIDGIDEDIKSIPFSRLTPHQPWKSYMKFQMVYVFLFYTLATITWVFAKDFKKFFREQNSFCNKKKHQTKEYVNLFAFKFIYFTVFLLIPLLVIDMSWYWIAGGFVLSHLFEGFTIACIFALAHLVEKVQFLQPDIDGNMESNWAVHQLYTTANFARRSVLTRFFTGGLNFQIEHHLFPTICHVHYPALSEIVKQKAIEFNIPYLEYPSLIDAIKSHYRLLKRLGESPD